MSWLLLILIVSMHGSTMKFNYEMKPRSVLLRMRTVSSKSCMEYQNKKLVHANSAVYEITWKNMVQVERPQIKNTVHALCMQQT